jgi:hypothetical protein
MEFLVSKFRGPDFEPRPGDLSGDTEVVLKEEGGDNVSVRTGVFEVDE